VPIKEEEEEGTMPVSNPVIGTSTLLYEIR